MLPVAETRAEGISIAEAVTFLMWLGIKIIAAAKLILLVQSSPTSWVYMICVGMCGNGVRIGMANTVVPHR